MAPVEQSQFGFEAILGLIRKFGDCPFLYFRQIRYKIVLIIGYKSIFRTQIGQPKQGRRFLGPTGLLYEILALKLFFGMTRFVSF